MSEVIRTPNRAGMTVAGMVETVHKIAGYQPGTNTVGQILTGRGKSIAQEMINKQILAYIPDKRKRRRIKRKWGRLMRDRNIMVASYEKHRLRRGPIITHTWIDEVNS